jgi:hypothetical protein|tara:strand:+ start:417 stop:527 length:111 start_codon:yes stop_codon:yes gene_type:complete
MGVFHQHGRFDGKIINLSGYFERKIFLKKKDKVFYK